MVKITFYDSIEEMWNDLSRAMKIADERVTEEQKKYRPGDIVVSDSGYGFPIFHEILDIETLVRENLWKYGDDDEDEGIYTLDLYRQPHMRYYCFANNFSEACRDGEFGDVHRSVILFKIPKLVFEELRKRASSLTVIVMDEVKTSRS